MFALEKIEDLDLDLLDEMIQREQIKYGTVEIIVSDLYLVPYVAEQINLYRDVFTELMYVSEYLVSLTPGSRENLISTEPPHKRGRIIKEYLQSNIRDFVQLWIYPNKEKILDFINERGKRPARCDLIFERCNTTKTTPIRVSLEPTSMLQISHSYLPNLCIEIDEVVHANLQRRKKYVRFYILMDQSTVKVRFLNMLYPLDFYFELVRSKLNLEEGYTDNLSGSVNCPSLAISSYMHSLSIKQYKEGYPSLGGRLEDFTRDGYGDSDLRGLILGAITIRVKEDVYQRIKQVKSLNPKTIFSNFLLLGVKPISCKGPQKLPAVCAFTQRNIKTLLLRSSVQFIDNSTKVTSSMETYDFKAYTFGTASTPLADIDNPITISDIAPNMRNLIDILDKEVGEGNYVLEVNLLEDLIKKGTSVKTYRRYMEDCLTRLSVAGEPKARISFYTLD